MSTLATRGGDGDGDDGASHDDDKATTTNATRSKHTIDNYKTVVALCRDQGGFMEMGWIFRPGAFVEYGPCCEAAWKLPSGASPEGKYPGHQVPGSRTVGFGMI